MTILVRIVQGLLVAAGLAACISAVIMAGIAHDDASARCYMVSVNGSTDKVPGPGCGTMSVYQVEAISAAAVGFAGIGVMIGAVAVGRMAPRRPLAPRAAAQHVAAPHAYGPPPQQPSGPFPQPGPQAMAPQGPPPGQYGH